MTILCPKSVRACALRLTRMNASGIPLDPLTPNARIQTAAFAELSLDPEMENGDENVIKSPSGESIAIIDRSCSVLKGMNLDLKLCGIPMTVLEMLLGVNPLFSEGDIVGGALRDTRVQDCLNLVMVEMWSRNVAQGSACNSDGSPMEGGWIHWVLPKTMRWELSSTLEFANGPLEVALSGYAEQNEVWYPSLPGPGFPSYQPGGGNPSGWPIGPSGPVLPIDIAPDPWSLQDQETIRNSGPLAWRSVAALPEPLDDCDYLYSPTCTPDTFAEDFCGPAGPIGEPWELIPLAVDGGPPIEILQLTGDCSVEPSSDEAQLGAVPLIDFADCCSQSCQTVSFSGVKTFLSGEGIVFGVGSGFFYDTVEDIALEASVITFSDGGFNAAMYIQIGLNDSVDQSPIATTFGMQYINPAGFTDPNYTLRMSWCQDGSFTVQFDSGPISQSWTVSNLAEFYTGTFNLAGLYLSPVGPEGEIPTSSVDAFSIACGSLEPGFVIPLQEFIPPVYQCGYWFDMDIDASSESDFSVSTDWVFAGGDNPCYDLDATWHDYYYTLGIGDPRPTVIDFSAPGWVSMAPEHGTETPELVAVPSNILIASKLFVDGVETGLSVVAHFPDTFSSVDTSGTSYTRLNSTSGGTAAWIATPPFSGTLSRIQEFFEYTLP